MTLHDEARPDSIPVDLGIELRLPRNGEKLNQYSAIYGLFE